MVTACYLEKLITNLFISLGSLVLRGISPEFTPLRNTILCKSFQSLSQSSSLSAQRAVQSRKTVLITVTFVSVILLVDMLKGASRDANNRPTPACSAHESAFPGCFFEVVACVAWLTEPAVCKKKYLRLLSTPDDVT